MTETPTITPDTAPPGTWVVMTPAADDMYAYTAAGAYGQVIAWPAGGRVGVNFMKGSLLGHKETPYPYDHEGYTVSPRYVRLMREDEYVRLRIARAAGLRFKPEA